MNSFERYESNKTVKVGDTIRCPTCGKEFRKKSYQHAFCRNKGHGNCKDVYHNGANPERSERTLKWHRIKHPYNPWG